MDASGYITITGRIKDLIIRGGENISPLEIENCLINHPDILEISIVGLRDERYGEIVAAFCVLREEKQSAKMEPIETLNGFYVASAEALQDWVRERLSKHLGKAIDFLHGRRMTAMNTFTALRGFQSSQNVT